MLCRAPGSVDFRGNAMDDRKAAILKALIEEYVETGQPVGSNTVARGAGLGVSSATVRNEMAVLEREGYVTHPHTSAGRIPTDKGYRHFVDHLARSKELQPASRPPPRRPAPPAAPRPPRPRARRPAPRPGLRRRGQPHRRRPRRLHRR